jgi:hypothetical protein
MTNTERNLYRRIAKQMLDELENNYHEVVLVPPSEVKHSGHMLRAVQSHNADWYRAFAKQFTNCRGIARKRMRRPRTYILKKNVVRALQRIIRGDYERGRFVQVDRLLTFIDNYRERRRRNRERIPVTLDADFHF